MNQKVKKKITYFIFSSKEYKIVQIDTQWQTKT